MISNVKTIVERAIEYFKTHGKTERNSRRAASILKLPGAMHVAFLAVRN